MPLGIEGSTTMLILSAADIHQLFPMQAAIAVMRDAMRSYSASEATQPLRMVINGKIDGLFGIMPVHLHGSAQSGFGIKTVVVKYDNPSRGLPSHVGVVVLFEARTGLPVAMLDAGVITEIRTAAVSAVATDALARSDAHCLAILGTGAQARAHIESVRLVRAIDIVKVWGRNEERVRELSEWARTRLGIHVEAAHDIHQATADADIICTTTSARTELLHAKSVRDGAHINAVGACQPGYRELASDIVEKSRIFVDSRDSALKECDDIAVPLRQGVLRESDIRGELGEVLLGNVTGREHSSTITLYESAGLAIQDVFSGFWIAKQASAQGIGTHVGLT